MRGLYTTVIVCAYRCVPYVAYTIRRSRKSISKGQLKSQTTRFAVTEPSSPVGRSSNNVSE